MQYDRTVQYHEDIAGSRPVFGSTRPDLGTSAAQMAPGILPHHLAADHRWIIGASSITPAYVPALTIMITMSMLLSKALDRSGLWQDVLPSLLPG